MPAMTAQDWDRRYRARELLWTDRPNRFLVSEVEHAGPPGRALDLACGEGRNAVWLAEQGWTVTGVDFSAVALGKAAQLAEERGVAVDWVRADLRDYRAVMRCYKLAIVFYLQVPPDERREFLYRAADAVARNGTLLVVGHDSSNLEAGFGGPSDPAVLYSSQDVVADLAGTGLVSPVQSPSRICARGGSSG